MIVDTSALVAIVNKEPGFEDLVDCMLSARTLSISAANYVELLAVCLRNRMSSDAARILLEELGIVIKAFDGPQARTAAGAYQRFGKGTGHPARLNMGDVYSYALAQTRNEPLLFVGDDFAHTDVVPALR